MQSGKRRMAVLSAVAAAAAVIFFVAVVRAHHVAATPVGGAGPGSGPNVQTASVRVGTIARYIRGVGRIVTQPGGTVDASFTQAGRIARIGVRMGDRVAAGQEIARLDLQPLALQAVQAQSSLAAADASTAGSPSPVFVQERAARERLAVARQLLARAERLARSGGKELSSQQASILQDEARVRGDLAALQRERTLLRGGVAARKDVEAAQQQLALDEAALAADRAKAGDPVLQARQAYAQALADATAASIAAKSAVASREQASAGAALARATLANGILRAPISGIVTAVTKSPGEWTNPGDPIATVVNPKASELVVAVSADEAERVVPGDIVKAGNAVGRVVNVVRPLNPMTQMSQVAAVFSAGAPAQIGSVLPVDIRTGVRTGVPIVPISAVVQDPSTQAYTVFVRGANGRFVPVTVRLGWSEGKWEEVHAAQVRAGTVVATYGSYELLAAGQ